MNFAVTYEEKFRHFDTVNEVKVIGIEVNTKFYELVPASAKILLNINGYTEEDIEEVLKLYKELKEKYENVIIQINIDSQRNIMEQLKQNNIPYMFLNFCRAVEQVYAMQLLGAREAYVTEELAFNLDNLQYFRKRDANGIKLRIFPDIAQSSDHTQKDIPAYEKFWIRPEDLIFYEPYIDTIEFYRRDDRLSVVYEIYKQRVYTKELNILILDAPDLAIKGSTLDPRFGKFRIDCQKKCHIGRCNLCAEMYHLAEKFQEAEIGVKRKRHIDNKSKYVLDEKTGILTLVKEEDNIDES